WRRIKDGYGGAGPFLFGERSIADAFFAPVVWRFNSYLNKNDLSPETKSYMKAMMALPEMQGWAAMSKEEKWRIEAAEV
ncbi:MAG: glutathione S-transferase, partial [Alphaproteobacteria bacterium]|nr:glutathione S-transferase [Alphaproteobacteria bacterium]